MLKLLSELFSRDIGAAGGSCLFDSLAGDEFRLLCSFDDGVFGEVASKTWDIEGI